MSSTSIVPTAAVASLRPLQLTLTRKKLRRIWGIVLIVQLLYVLQLVAMADMYIQTSWRSSTPFLTFLVNTFLVPREIWFATHYAIVVGITYAILSTGFLGLLLRMLWRSINNRELSFGDSVSPQSPQQPERSKLFKRLWVRYGIRGERFEEGLVVREGLEMFLQIWQAYTTSQTINTKFVNQSFSVLIVLSAITHPVLSRLYAGQVAKKRFACVLVEFFIDILWASILPLCVFVNYWHIDRTTTVDQIFATFDFGFYEKAQREVRHLVILSWWQYLVAVFPAVSAFVNLRSVMRLLATVEVVTVDRTASAPSFTPVRSGPTVSTKAGRPILVALPSEPRKSSFVHWGHRIITVGGIMVCVASVAATSLFASTGRISDANCLHRLYPWFVTDDACVVVFLGCTELQISGHKVEMDAVMSTIDVASIGLLGISDCPALEIPSSLIKAQYLGGLLLYNCTIVTWPEDLEFTSDNFPSIHSLGLTKISLPSTPPKSLTANPAWPVTLKRIYFTNTDISEVAQQMTTHWSWITSWTCISCGLETLPIAFYEMPQLEKWIVWNTTITAMPTYSPSPTLLWPSLEVMMWSNNPLLTSVGDDIWRAASSGSLHTMSLAYTNLQDIPERWRARLSTTNFTLFGFASPLCASQAAQTIPFLNCTHIDSQVVV